jgi:hypothetical protein
MFKLGQVQNTSMRHASLILFIAAVAIVAGCVGQSPVAGGQAISFRASVEPTQIRANETATLFVDVENTGIVDIPKVFIEAYDLGALNGVRTGSAVTGTLPIKVGTRPITIGGNISNIITSINCTSSADCPDEDFGGCGSCAVGIGQNIGQCQPPQALGSLGSICEKQCECGYGMVCKFDAVISRKICEPAPHCEDGGAGNACSGIGEYCTPWGETIDACAGADGFPSNIWSVSTGITAPQSDDCGCPGNLVCRGDGTCGAPTGCYVTVYGLKSGELQTLECSLNVAQPGSLIRATTPVTIALRAQFRARLSGSLTLDFLSAEEWRRRQTTNTLETKPQSYTFSDGNIQAVLDFDRNPPFVSGDRVIASLSVRSTGDGSVLVLNPSDVLISQYGTAFNCPLETPLRSEKGVFTPVTCTLDVPQTAIAATYPITLTIYYDYEIRRTVPVSIIKT